MDPDPTLVAAGLGVLLVVILLLRFLFRSTRMNTTATDLTKVRETDLKSEPVPLPTYTRTLTMRERILLHLRYVASNQDDSTGPTLNEAIDAVTMGDLKGLHVALSAMEAEGEIRSTGLVGSPFNLTDEGRIRANGIHGDFIGSIVMKDGEEISVGEAIGFEGFPLIGDHIESWEDGHGADGLRDIIASMMIAYSDGRMTFKQKQDVAMKAEENDLDEIQIGHISSYIKAVMEVTNLIEEEEIELPAAPDFSDIESEEIPEFDPRFPI